MEFFCRPTICRRIGFGVYAPILPVVGGMMFVLKAAKLGMKIDRWFTRKIQV